ncbi:MAG: hypothetical protein SW833_22890 [Cyanobacteriota bacterium]|nr:hypothetical protein [Cyanobacteriota bacterium]
MKSKGETSRPAIGNSTINIQVFFVLSSLSSGCLPDGGDGVMGRWGEGG